MWGAAIVFLEGGVELGGYRGSDSDRNAYGLCASPTVDSDK
jgi:hypothetical protein